MNNNTYSGRSILLALGTGEESATFALRQIQFPPRASDPDAGATVILVKAAQRGMTQLGCPLSITGRLDELTEACLTRVSGANWESQDWMMILKDILVKRNAGLKISEPINYEPTEGFTLYSPMGALVLAAAAGAAYLIFKK